MLVSVLEYAWCARYVMLVLCMQTDLRVLLDKQKNVILSSVVWLQQRKRSGKESKPIWGSLYLKVTYSFISNTLCFFFTHLLSNPVQHLWFLLCSSASHCPILRHQNFCLLFYSINIAFWITYCSKILRHKSASCFGMYYVLVGEGEVAEIYLRNLEIIWKTNNSNFIYHSPSIYFVKCASNCTRLHLWGGYGTDRLHDVTVWIEFVQC